MIDAKDTLKTFPNTTIDSISQTRDVSQKDIEFSMVVLCYRAEESVIPFVENLHSIFSFFNFNWEIILVANY